MRNSSSLFQYLESVVYGHRSGPMAAIVRCLLIALSGVYRLVLRAYLIPFQTGVRPAKRLSRPVISIGNINVGGTGKTPTVQYVVRGLIDRGWSPAVLSYGYGGTLHGAFGIVSDQSSLLLQAETAGDEPVMLAQTMPGVPVLVGKDRRISGRLAISDLGADILVLDDGFQVWKLHRDFEIVLVSAENPLDNGHTLPAGRLREPPRSLLRADCVIVTGADRAGEPPVEIRKLLPETPVFLGAFIPSAAHPLEGGPGMSVDTIRGKRVLALSGIANPKPFENSLLDLGAVVAGAERLPDHHQYSEVDIEAVNRSAVGCSAETIITTEKDAVKLRGRQFDLPVLVLRIELCLNDEPGFWELAARKVGRKPGVKQESEIGQPG